MQIKKLIISLLVILFGGIIQAQGIYEDVFRKAVRQGDLAFEKGEYEEAIRQYRAAAAVDPSKKGLINNKLYQVYEKAENLLIEAIAARDLAEKEERQIQLAVDSVNAMQSLLLQTQGETQELDQRIQLLTTVHNEEKQAEEAVANDEFERALKHYQTAIQNLSASNARDSSTFYKIQFLEEKKRELTAFVNAIHHGDSLFEKKNILKAYEAYLGARESDFGVEILKERLSDIDEYHADNVFQIRRKAKKQYHEILAKSAETNQFLGRPTLARKRVNQTVVHHPLETPDFQHQVLQLYENRFKRRLFGSLSISMGTGGIWGAQSTQTPLTITNSQGSIQFEEAIPSKRDLIYMGITSQIIPRLQLGADLDIAYCSGFGHGIYVDLEKQDIQLKKQRFCYPNGIGPDISSRLFGTYAVWDTRRQLKSPGAVFLQIQLLAGYRFRLLSQGDEISLQSPEKPFELWHIPDDQFSQKLKDLSGSFYDLVLRNDRRIPTLLLGKGGFFGNGADVGMRVFIKPLVIMPRLGIFWELVRNIPLGFSKEPHVLSPVKEAISSLQFPSILPDHPELKASLLDYFQQHWDPEIEVRFLDYQFMHAFATRFGITFDL